MNRSGHAPWEDWNEGGHGRLDDVSNGGLDDVASRQQDTDVFALSAGDGGSEVNESRDDTAEDQSRLGHQAWHNNEDGPWFVGNDGQDDVPQELPGRPAMYTHAHRDGENRGGNALETEHRHDDGKPSGLADREGPGDSAHEVRDGAAEDHQANAIDLQNCDNGQQVLDGDPGRDRGEHEARDGVGDDQQEDAHEANGEDAQALNEHQGEHDSQGEGSHHCGDQSGGQDDDVLASDGSAQQAPGSSDEDHQINAIQSEDHGNDSQQTSDNNEDRDDDEDPDHDEDHTNDPGSGEHHARDGGGEDQQGDDHGGTGEDGHEVQQTADEHHDECDSQGEGSHHGGDHSEHEGLRGQDDDVAAFLSSDTLPWKETSEWCASAMGTTPDEHDPPQMSSLLEAWRDEGVMHCEAVGQDDAPEVTHANAFAVAQPDHGLLTL